MTKLEPQSYRSMTSHAQAAYNAAMFVAVHADYGYTCQGLVDDYDRADILAISSGGTGDSVQFHFYQMHFIWLSKTLFGNARSSVSPKDER